MTTNDFISAQPNVSNSCDLDDYFLPYEELLDILPSTPRAAASTRMEQDNTTKLKNNDLKRRAVSKFTAFPVVGWHPFV